MNELASPSNEFDEMRLFKASLITTMNVIEKHEDAIKHIPEMIEDTINNKLTQVAQTAAETAVSEYKNLNEISDFEVNQISGAVCGVACKRLGIHVKKNDRNALESEIYEKYFETFRHRCASDTRKLGHLGYRYGATTQNNYKEALKDINNWYPEEGVEELKRSVDLFAAERKAARELAKKEGYK